MPGTCDHVATRVIEHMTGVADGVDNVERGRGADVDRRRRRLLLLRSEKGVNDRVRVVEEELGPMAASVQAIAAVSLYFADAVH